MGLAEEESKYTEMSQKIDPFKKRPRVSLDHMMNNLLVVVDVECTGRKAGYHEVTQLCILPLDVNLEPSKDFPEFNELIKPKYLGRAEAKAMHVHKIPVAKLNKAHEAEHVIKLLLEWFDDLDLGFNRNLIPLAFNYPFEHSHLGALLGPELRDRLFHGHYRDAMGEAISMNDKAVYRGGKVIFPEVSLRALCKQLDIENKNAHDAYSDCVAEAELYKKLLHLDVL